jgi:hypothetical protein
MLGFGQSGSVRYLKTAGIIFVKIQQHIQIHSPKKLMQQR